MEKIENKTPINKIESNDELTTSKSPSVEKHDQSLVESADTKLLKSEGIIKDNSDNSVERKSAPDSKLEVATISKKPVKPPKLEDKPFNEFINSHFIPGLKSSIEVKGTSVTEIKLIDGKRPVVGGNCWMVYCEISEQRRFWLCFNKEIITSDKTILLAESNSDPSIVESFLIDEKKTTLPLLISRVLQRLNGQKWIGAN